ncbi:SRPBCC domain-containing protein [Georgenia faecalis]|uniref:SRPBCC domain-containing protein n=1 Tax=Georgenia faecalis TaxID=2483799 RepID=A0ABV9D8B5_9MICO|nr:SRPBCC domain-containing protein [Georgenia faecalis]
MDVQAQIDAVTRTLRTADIDGEPSRIQTIAQEYPADIGDVWDAATNPDRIARWFMPVEGDLRLGGRYQLIGNAGGQILACAPPADGTAEYRVTWEYAGGVSWVTVRLASTEPERTRFELEHTARVADVPAEMWETFGPGATGVGWDQGLLGLALHLRVQDATITPEEGEAWSLSDEGKAFSRAAADRWADAHVAAGADREAATRAADATFGFYTGEVPGA